MWAPCGVLFIMMMIKLYAIQIFWILYFYLLGIGVSFLVGGFIPGSVIGMLLLFGALSLGWVKPHRVSGVANLLIRYMVLFFVPPAIGIMAAWSKVEGQIWAVLTAMVVSTIAVIAAVALSQQFLEKRLKR